MVSLSQYERDEARHAEREADALAPCLDAMRDDLERIAREIVWDNMPGLSDNESGMACARMIVIRWLDFMDDGHITQARMVTGKHMDGLLTECLNNMIERHINEGW